MSLRDEIGVPADAELIEVNGARLAVAREGNGPPVVCLHAIGHGGRDFEEFTAAVKNRFEVIRIDWPGQGRSQPDSQPPTAARYAELLADVLDRLNVSAPIIVGNSIGGAAAIHYANVHRVRALVLCNPGGLLRVNRFATGACNAFSAFFAQGARGAWWFPRLFCWYYRFMVLPSPAAAAQRGRIIKAGYEIASVLRDAWKQFGTQASDIRDLAVSLSMPVLFAWAESDKIISLSASMACIKRMKNARVVTFHAGHAAFLERPREFIEEFVKFADTLPLSHDAQPDAVRNIVRRHASSSASEAFNLQPSVRSVREPR